MLTDAKKRLVEFSSSKGLKPYKLCQKISIAENTFANKSEISVENLVKVFTHYPELNFDWVITGRGEMLMSNTEKDCQNCNEWKEKYYNLLEKNNELHEEHSAYLKKQQLVK